MKILLAVDGSAYTKKMLTYLATHDLFRAGHDFTVLTVQAALPPRARAAVGKAIVDDYYASEAQKILTPVTKFLQRHDIDAPSCWKVGAAGLTIAQLARSGRFDLVIMGSHGHGALLNLVLGSVATQVLAECDTPVLLVR